MLSLSRCKSSVTLLISSVTLGLDMGVTHIYIKSGESTELRVKKAPVFLRDLESRERKALEKMLGRAELSSAAAWCYPACRVAVLASADLQITGGMAGETRRITKDLKRGTACRGCFDMYGSEEG